MIFKLTGRFEMESDFILNYCLLLINPHRLTEENTFVKFNRGGYFWYKPKFLRMPKIAWCIYRRCTCVCKVEIISSYFKKFPLVLSI